MCVKLCFAVCFAALLVGLFMAVQPHEMEAAAASVASWMNATVHTRRQMDRHVVPVMRGAWNRLRAL